MTEQTNASGQPSAELASASDGGDEGPTRDQVWEICEELHAQSHQRPDVHQVARKFGVHHLKISRHFNAWRSGSPLIDLFPHVKTGNGARKFEKGLKKLLADVLQETASHRSDELVGAVDRLEKDLKAEKAAHDVTRRAQEALTNERDELKRRCEDQTADLASKVAAAQQAIGAAGVLAKDKELLKIDNERLQQAVNELQKRMDDADAKLRTAGVELNRARSTINALQAKLLGRAPANVIGGDNAQTRI